MRFLTQAQKNLVRADSVDARLLATFYLDEGTFRFCDDTHDVSDGVNTYIGANALTDTIEVRSGRDLSAEPVTLVCDGNRMADFGIADPARVLNDMLGYLHTQRRIDFALGLMPPTSKDVQLIIPLYAGKINYARLVDEDMNFIPEAASTSKLEIVIDGLATRYNRATFRTRTDADQREIDPTDAFFSFVDDSIEQEGKLYWGRDAPRGNANAGRGVVGRGSGTGGGFGNNFLNTRVVRQ